MTWLAAALAGALVMAGVVTGVATFTRRPVQEQSVRPPSRLAEALRAATGPRHRRRLAIAVVAALVVLLITGWPVAAVSALAAVAVAPHLLSKRPAQQRIARLEALEAWTRKLADLLGASRALEDALVLSVRQAPEAIRPEVEDLARRLRARMPAEQALRLWADDLADATADRIAGALILASRRGSGVRNVLNQLAEMVAKEVAARREIEAARAQHRTTLRWVLIFLGGYTVFVSLQHSYSAPFDTAAGQLAMGVVAVLYAGGLWWIHRLATPAASARLLAQTTDEVEGAVAG